MEGKVETPREKLPPIGVLDKIIVAFAGPLFKQLAGRGVCGHHLAGGAGR